MTVLDEAASLEVEKRAILAIGKYCLSNREFVAQFNRLSGCQLLRSEKRTPLEMAIDNACGYDGERDEDWLKWTEFIMDTVWARLPEETQHEFLASALASMMEEAIAKAE